MDISYQKLRVRNNLLLLSVTPGAGSKDVCCAMESAVVPDLDANSFPAMNSSMPCSCMESLPLDLLFFLSTPSSDLTLIQGKSCQGDLGDFSRLKFFWGEMLFMGRRK